MSWTLSKRNLCFNDGVQYSGGGEAKVAEGNDENKRHCLNRGGSKVIGIGAEQTGVPCASLGYLKGLTL